MPRKANSGKIGGRRRGRERGAGGGDERGGEESPAAPLDTVTIDDLQKRKGAVIWPIICRDYVFLAGVVRKTQPILEVARLSEHGVGRANAHLCELSVALSAETVERHPRRTMQSTATTRLQDGRLKQGQDAYLPVLCLWINLELELR